jgi:ABC-type uncharacterized transport system substrate-binding protein
MRWRELLRPTFIPGLQPFSTATRTIPIVFAWVSDPLGSGFVASLANPGGNIIWIDEPEQAVVIFLRGVFGYQ